MAVGGSGYGPFSYTGVSGYRGELSLLRERQGLELGSYLGYGVLDGLDAYDFILGTDIRKNVTLTNKNDMKLGIQADFNIGRSVADLDWTHLDESTVRQYRPYLLSTTTAEKEFYGGIHGLVAEGHIQCLQYDGEWNSQTHTWTESIDLLSYDFQSVGAGVTMGYEKQVRNVNLQLQMDFSYVMSKALNKVGTSDDYWGSSDHEGLIVSFGSAISFDPGKTSKRNEPVIPTYTPPPVTTGSIPQFDPLTGKLVDEDQETLTRFDPLTGLPKEIPVETRSESSALSQFDPITGQLIPANDSGFKGLPRETRLKLLRDPLVVSEINNSERSYYIADLDEDGLVLTRKLYSRKQLERLNFSSIRQIKIKGQKAGLEGGTTACVYSTLGFMFYPALITHALGLSEVSGAIMGWSALIVPGATGIGYRMKDVHVFEVPEVYRMNSEYKRDHFEALLNEYAATGRLPDFDPQDP